MARTLASAALRDFAVDRTKAYIFGLGGVNASATRKILFWLGNSEFHCVVAYRFGQYADELAARNRIAGNIARIAHRLVNRWLTHIDHADISHHARIGPGMLLMHRHGVIIGPAVIGKNCVIHQNVTIGQRVAGGDQGIPTIGDNVWIGPGAVLTGTITIGDGVTISAGTILSKDVPPRCLVAGNPGRVVTRDYDNSSIMNFTAPD
jgi:serine O-acetyltransferase